MLARRIISFVLFVGLTSVFLTFVARADQPKISLSPDRVLKGTTPTITITLDKSIPDQKEIKSVRIGGQVVAVQEPTAEGKLFVPLPKLDIAGRADVDVIGKDDKSVAVGQLTYVESAEPSLPPAAGTSKEVALLVLYIGLIVLLPFICTVYDIRKSYRERADVFSRLRPHATIDEIGALLTKMDQGPTGLIGLTRGLLALTLVLAVAFAAFHLVVFAPPRVPDIADKLLMLLAGTLTAITGFYFGSKAATEAAQQQPSAGGAKATSAAVPKISEIRWDPNARKLTVIGEAFGQHKGKAIVKVGEKEATVTDSNWTDNQIEVAVPADLHGDVNVVVTNENGQSSSPKQTKI